MFWDRIKDSIKKTENKAEAKKNEKVSKDVEKPKDRTAELFEENFDENLTSDVDEGLLEFRLNIAREKLEEKGVPKAELEEIFAKIRKDTTGESLKSLLAELD